MDDAFWTKKQAFYSTKDWVTKPSIFAETVKEYLPESGALLELGAGLGQDSVYFAGFGYNVTSTNLEIAQLKEKAGGMFRIEAVDLRNNLPFAESSFEVVYAHLCLHYFDQTTTVQIFSEIYRVLKPGGLLAFLVNSTADPECGQGKVIEPDYFEIEGTAKRYFSVATATAYAQAFQPLLADNQGVTYKDKAKGVRSLIRFVGTKR